MLLVGLTGGIGAGKSTVARMLAERGAVVFDADDFARQAVEAGTPGYERVVAEFGPDAVTASGGLNREWLADRVFADPDERRRLEAIVHPEVARLSAEAIEPYRATDRVVVYVVPLLVENQMESMFDVVIVVSSPEEARIARVAEERGVSEKAIRERMAAQLPDRKRERAAHVVIRNDGSMEDLAREVDVLWQELERRAPKIEGR
jgi:dephospho-CoA kinase